jgi:bifunctional DNase/RNase
VSHPEKEANGASRAPLRAGWLLLILGLALPLLALAAADRHAAGEDAVPLQVMTVLPMGDGGLVLLRNSADGKLLPISVGGTEALSIAHRLDGSRFPRPLTHDLVERLMDELGGKLVEVRIDALQGGVFTAVLIVKRRGRSIRIDSRASDAIALALGQELPVLCAAKVMEEAGVTAEDLFDGEHEGGGLEGSSGTEL